MTDANARRAFLAAGTAGLGSLLVSRGVAAQNEQAGPAAGSQFVSRGQGAVSRSIEDKLHESVSIGDFGARTDAADNKIAIERAVASALTDQRSLFIPAGTFTYSQIDFGRNDQTQPRRLIIFGPGTLRSTFSGTSITASRGYFYDLVLDGVRFESEAGAGTRLIDGDRFIRLVMTPGSQIDNFDWVIHSREYLQSVRMIGVIIRGGRGAVVKAPMLYDCVFTHNIVEFVTDGFVIDGPNDPATHTCTIDNNIIEGIGGRAIVLATCLATSVSGNYFEGNRVADILLNAGSAPHKGLKVQNNGIQMAPERIARGEFGIVWGRSTALPVKAGGNFCTGRLHDTEGVTSIIDMAGDFSQQELYRGYRPETQPGRSPVGRAVYNDGLVQYLAWFDRYLAMDAYQNEVRFGGKHVSRVGDSIEPQVLTFGANSPEADPNAFERKKWARGSLVLNSTANAAGAFGWICTAAGSPGRWRALPG